MKKVISEKFESIGRIQKGFEGTGYICSQQIATTLYLAFHLDKPVLVEGPAGAGKTELAVHFFNPKEKNQEPMEMLKVNVEVTK